MPDYAAEQQEEICALESIYMDDMREVDGDGPQGVGKEGPCWAIRLTPEGDDVGDEAETSDIEISLAFAFTEKYPEEPPLLAAKNVRGNVDVAKLTSILEEQARENLGMAMIFTLASFAKDWLREQTSYVASFERETDEARRKREEEEEDRRREELRKLGTQVTPESYKRWFDTLQAEQALERAKLLAAQGAGPGAAGDKAKRLTGRGFFEQRAAGQLGIAGGQEEVDEDAELEGSADEENDPDFELGDEDDEDDDDDDDDDDDLLDQYLAEKEGGKG